MRQIPNIGKSQPKWLELIIYKQMKKGAILGSARQLGIAAGPTNKEEMHQPREH